METFNIDIDTSPIAREVDGISNHVKVTTGAVVAMQAAVVNEEVKAADRITTNVNKGFYTLIQSQISQKVAKLQSEVDAHLMEMTNQKQALLAIKGRMEKDYQMVSKRYNKLFNSLNTNLKNRIYNLDTPLMNFADKEQLRLENRRKMLTATVPIAQLEPIALSQNIIASNAKAKGASILGIIKKYVKTLIEQDLLTDEILLSKRVADNQNSQTIYTPVVIADFIWNKNTPAAFDIVSSEEILQKHSQAKVSNKLQDMVSELEWSKNEKTSKKIQVTFEKAVSNSSANNDIKELARKLFSKNEITTF